MFAAAFESTIMVSCFTYVQQMTLLEAGSAPIRTRSELVGRQAELAAAARSAAADDAREATGSQRTASVPNLRSVMTDPLLGQYSIPPIQTAIAPAGEWLCQTCMCTQDHGTAGHQSRVWLLPVFVLGSSHLIARCFAL